MQEFEIIIKVASAAELTAVIARVEAIQKEHPEATFRIEVNW